MRDIPQPPELLPDGRLPAKLVAVRTLVLVRPEMQTVGDESRYQRWLGTDAAPFDDPFDAGKDWTRISHGRLKKVGMLLIKNLAGMNYQKVPTPQEREWTARLILGVRLEEEGGNPTNLDRAHVLVRPGEDLPFEPAPGLAVWVRCEEPTGECPCMARSYPA